MVELEVDSLGKVYGEGPGAITAIEELTFDVSQGEFICIVGPSGCGKTTLLKCLAGLLRPTKGFASLGGEQIQRPPEGLALVFQDYSRSLMPWMTVQGNVTLPLLAQRIPKAVRHAKAKQALDAVGLGDSLRMYPWQLSGGMQQRVAIARALAYEPRLLLMDEPFASVDAQTRAELEDLILDVHRLFGMTVVFVTHDIDESVYLADRVIALSKRPTTVTEVVSVNLPRPRDQLFTRQLAEFVELRSRILRRIRQ